MDKLLWLTPCLHSGPLRDGLSHDLASVRYRLLSPARTLARTGFSSDIINPAEAQDVSGLDLSGYAAMVIGKHAHSDPAVVKALGDRFIELAKIAHGQGVRTIADVCDDRFEHPLLGAYWRELVQRVDHVVAGSEELAQIARKHTAARVTTIADPVEGERADARFGPPRRRGAIARMTGAAPQSLKLLWYGHQSNLDEIEQFLPKLAAWAGAQNTVDALTLTIVSASGFGAEDFTACHGGAGQGPLHVAFTPWSAVAQQQALRDCDLVIIPATLVSAEKRVKTANRLTEALWAGRHVLAHPVPSYLEFRDCAWISEDLIAGLGAALRHPAGVLRQVQAGQEVISRRYSPQAVGQLWSDAVRGA